MRASRKLWAFLNPYWRWVILAPLLMTIEVSMDLIQPRLVEHIVDAGIGGSNLSVVVSTGVMMVGAALFGMAGGMGCTVFAILAGQAFGADLRGTLFRRVQALSFGNLDKLETGKLITRLTNDVTQVQEIVMMALRMLVRAPLLLVGSVIMALLTSRQLAILYVVLMPLVLAMAVWVINRTFPLFGEVQRRLDAVNTVMQENLAGVRVVKAFARSVFEIDRFRQANDRLTDQSLVAVRTGAITMPFMMLVLNFGVVGALWVSGQQIKAGSMEVGQLIAFLNYLGQTLMSLMMVSMLVVRISRSEASAERIQQVLDAEPEVKRHPEAIESFAPRGRVAFDDVSLKYDHDEADPVLKGISFVAEPGQTVAILGATGSGKSSLVSVIPRFYDVASGRVTIDGVDIRNVDESALRASIGVALQESVLFSGTIRDNIRYGRPEATDEEVVEAAKAAQAHDFIVSFPDGYDSPVDARGVNLSGGQKQRLAIARALLVRPSILILDDSTSAVDVETEAQIQTALAESGRAHTRFVVAQRISSVLSADKILVLDDGQIVAEGTHGELIESSPVYREIYESQLANGAVSHGAA